MLLGQVALPETFTWISSTAVDKEVQFRLMCVVVVCITSLDSYVKGRFAVRFPKDCKKVGIPAFPSITKVPPLRARYPFPGEMALTSKLLKRIASFLFVPVVVDRKSV